MGRMPRGVGTSLGSRCVVAGEIRLAAGKTEGDEVVVASSLIPR